MSHIVILARRMGMRWKDLRPGDGILHAEGHRHVLTSTVSRSPGIVLHCSFGGKARSLRRSTSNQSQVSTLHPERDEAYIPTSVADKLGFGLFGGGGERLDVPHLQIRPQLDIANGLDNLDAFGGSGAKLRTHPHGIPGFTFCMGEIVALTTPMAH